MGPEDLRRAVPPLAGRLAVPGLRAPVEVWRDPEGVPHVRAASVHDAFVAQGFVHAQDRLWQMEFDRRRAAGRWAELVGPPGVAQDVQMRRLRLLARARADYAGLDAETRAMLDAYAGGVNAFVRTTPVLPVEFRILEGPFEPWQPWDSLAVFKVRHVLMGLWQLKAWRGQLLQALGPAGAARLCPGSQPAPMLILPPGAEFRGPEPDGGPALEAAAPALAAVADWDGGSNNWALAGSRTASGRPLVAGDPHRPLEVPNVYYQNHLACPEFDAIGLSFPGVPGFPHFGHTRHVAWCVTHTGADYQDLYVERFDPADPRRYEYCGSWREAEVTRELIGVRGGEPRPIEVTVTHHGPVVLGDPRRGAAIALRYTATAAPNATFAALLPMLRARSAEELEAAMRPWVDPVHNLVFADAHGRIGYRCRGQVPVRAPANAWVPVPGWDGAHEWTGTVPFEAMPALRDPAAGFIVTANSRVAGAEFPYFLSLDFAPDFRTRRLVARLQPLRDATAADMAALHADRVSLPAREFLALLADLPLADPAARQARDLLGGWDGRMEADSVAATVYAVFRERLVRDLFEPLLGPLASEAFGGAPRGAVTHLARLRARLPEWIRAGARWLLPPGADWPAVLGAALAGALAELRATLGPDPAAWRWGRLHATRPQHPLSAVFPALAPLLDPPALPVGGDGDTVQAAAFLPGSFTVSTTSVARYVFDLGDWERSGWVVPLGASGHPGSPHYADQAAAWAAVRLYPMRYDWERIRAEAESHQVLVPA